VVAGRIIGCNRIKREGAPSRAQRLVQKYDVLFQMVRPYQQNNLYFLLEDGQYVASTGYAVLRSKEGVSDSGFLYHIVHSENFLSQVLQRCTGSNYPAINSSSLEDIYVPFPPLAEQRRIAACLSALDEMLAATNGKLEQLKAYKKGLMQQLFANTTGGKSLIINDLQIQKLRFPEFRNEKEWIYYNGDKMFEPVVNKNHNSDLPVLAITQDQGAIPRDLIGYTVIVSDKSVEGYKVVEIGDFIISLRSFQGGIEYSNYRGLCSPAYIVLRKRNDNVCDDFYRYYFKSNQYIQDLNRNLEGIRDGKMVSYKQFSEIMIPCPKYEEQRKIASCLSTMDDQINAYTEKVALLEQYKKGLMQRMFPQNKII
jgi:type I restriction enzyme S subunit